MSRRTSRPPVSIAMELLAVLHPTIPAMPGLVRLDLGIDLAELREAINVAMELHGIRIYWHDSGLTIEPGCWDAARNLASNYLRQRGQG